MPGQVEAIYWNALYPGHIHLPEGTSYPWTTNGYDCAVFVVRHHSPVVVTDFSNQFVLKEFGPQKHLHLKNLIPSNPTNTISVDFQATGNPETQHAIWTREHLYQIYRTQSFTELTVGVERPSSDDYGYRDIALFNASIDRFLELYRVSAVDRNANRLVELQSNSPTVRSCLVAYSGDTKKLPLAAERLVAFVPTHFPDFVQFSIGEFATHAVRLNVDRLSISLRVQHHMRVGSKISANQSALMDCFSALSRGKNFRYAVVDAFSVAEVEAMDLILDASKSMPTVKERYEKLMKRSGRVTVKDAIHSFLPFILSQQLLSKPALIADLDKCRKLRHSVVHERTAAHAEDAEYVLNTAQQLIFAADEFRGQP